MPYRRWTRLLGIIGTTVLTLVVTLLALLQLPPVATWVMRRIITVVPFNPGYQLQVGRVSGDWLHRLALENVRLIWKSRELARLDRLELGYDLRHLRGPVTRLRELTVIGARAEAHREGKTWDLASALKSSADTTKHGGGFRIENLKLRDVQLMAELSPDSVVRVRGLNLAGRDLVVGDTVLLALDQLNFGLSPPGSTRWFALATRGAITAAEFRFDPLRIQTEETRIAGRAVLPRNLEDPRLADRLDVRLQATPLAMADLAAAGPLGDTRRRSPYRREREGRGRRAGHCPPRRPSGRGDAHPRRRRTSHQRQSRLPAARQHAPARPRSPLQDRTIGEPQRHRRSRPQRSHAQTERRTGGAPDHAFPTGGKLGSPPRASGRFPEWQRRGHLARHDRAGDARRDRPDPSLRFDS